MDYIVHGVAKSWTRLSDFHFTSLPALFSFFFLSFLFFFFIMHLSSRTVYAILSASDLTQPMAVKAWNPNH